MTMEEYRGYTINIEQDEYSDDPRKTCDWLGKMICFHRTYDLGDKHNFDVDGLKEFVKEADIIFLPLYLYDHSGITMNTSGFSCPWDSGQVGVIYVETADVKKEWGWKRLSAKRLDKILNLLKEEVSTYDDFLTGNVWGYQIAKDGESLDSCWGFFGDPDGYVLTEAKSMVDWYVKDDLKKRIEKLKTYIKNRVPLEKRSFA